MFKVLLRGLKMHCLIKYIDWFLAQITMLRKFYRKNIETIKKMIENIATKQEQHVKNNTDGLVQTKNGKNFQLVRDSLLKDGPKSGTIYFLCHPKRTLLSTFLNPQLHFQPKFLLWNTLKRQITTSSHTEKLGNTNELEYPRRIKKLGRTKSFHYNESQEPMYATEYIPRSDDLYLSMNKEKIVCNQSWEESHLGFPPLLPIGKTKNDANPDLSFPLVIKVVRPKQQNTHRLWKRKIRNFEFTKLCAPTPSFSDRERRKSHIKTKKYRKETNRLNNVVTLTN